MKYLNGWITKAKTQQVYVELKEKLAKEVGLEMRSQKNDVKNPQEFKLISIVRINHARSWNMKPHKLKEKKEAVLLHMESSHLNELQPENFSQALHKDIDKTAGQKE